MDFIFPVLELSPSELCPMLMPPRNWYDPDEIAYGDKE